MFRVMIVDDEPLVRLALGTIIPWRDLECEVVAEAADGREAWERIATDQDIDLMIIDMSMPVMDANALLSKMKEANLTNAPLSIVLSAHSDFDFVRKAFLLGALDYIMKANLDPEHIIPVIHKAVRKLKENAASSWRTDPYNDSDRKQREIWLRGLFREKDYFYSLNLTQDDSFQRWVSQYANSQHVIVSILPDERLDNIEHLSNIIRQGLESLKIPFQLIQIKEDEHALLLCFESRDSYLNVRARVIELLDSLCNTVKNFLNVTLSVGVADSCTDWKIWHSRYIQARHLACLRFSEGPGRVYYPESVSVDVGPPIAPWDYRDMMQLIEKGDTQWQQKLLAGLKQLNELSKMTLESSLPVYEELIWNIGAWLHAQAMNWNQVLETRRRPYEIVEQFMFREDLHAWIEQLVVLLADVLHSEK